MNPTANPTIVPGQPIAPAANNTTPQGVAQPKPVAAPVPTQLPTAPAVAATPAPVQTPNFDTQGTMNAIANYYQIPRQTAQIVNQGQSQGNVAGQQFEKQKAENTINIQNAQNQLNPSTYTITKDPKTGSVNIINSLGDKVDLPTYVNLTGENPAQVLQKAGVTNPADQKFIAAYNNFQTYAQDMIAAQNGDQQAKIAVGEFQSANPGLKNMELGQLSSAFMAQYGNYFGQPTNASSTDMGGINGVNPTLTSQNNPVSSSPYYELSNYPQLNTTNPNTNALLSGAPVVSSPTNTNPTNNPANSGSASATSPTSGLSSVLQQYINSGG